ncbi:MAG: hypothetical protein ACI4RC_02040 [Oscillospiraceae bacterium]
MNKSVYSLVLADDVVEAIDEMAYSMGTSRSNLINQILAEKVSMVTPEMRIRDMFSLMEKLMDSRFKFMDHPSETMLMAKSPLKYKYKPTIKYNVELFRAIENSCVGRLRISMRTQSGELINALNNFFAYWIYLEKKYLGTDKLWKTADANYEREFYLGEDANVTSEQIAESISDYVNALDDSIKFYFENMDNKPLVQKEVLQKYLKLIT